MRRLLPLLPLFALAAACGPNAPAISAQQAKAFASVNAAANAAAAGQASNSANQGEVNVLPTTASTALASAPDNVLPTTENGLSDPSAYVLPTTAATVAPSTTASTPPSPTATARATPSAAASASASASNGAPVLEVIGDSYSSGVPGLGQGAQAWPAILAKRLHWRAHVDAAPLAHGSGYVMAGQTGMQFSSRVASVVAAHPTVIVIFGSRSDLYVSSATVYTAAQALFATLHAKLPTTPIVVVGPCWPLEYLPPLSTPLSRSSLINAVKNAAAAAQLPFIDPIAQQWFTAANASLIGDGTHPNNAGMVHLADEMEKSIDYVAPTLLKPYTG